MAQQSAQVSDKYELFVLVFVTAFWSLKQIIFSCFVGKVVVHTSKIKICWLFVSADQFGTLRNISFTFSMQKVKF